MFQDDRDYVEPPHDDDEDDYEYIRPSERYKPTDEAITEEDEMDMIEFANEVEMVEDIGSLAQSLGASHLGQSLLLQREIATRDGANKRESEAEGVSQQQGLHVGGSSHISGDAAAGGGGIRSAMERATSRGEDLPPEGFRSRAPESAPRLDSFKMIKVIGKGSFGTLRALAEVMACLCRILKAFHACYGRLNLKPTTFCKLLSFELFLCYRQGLFGKGTHDRRDVCPKSPPQRQHYQAKPSRAHKNRT